MERGASLFFALPLEGGGRGGGEGSGIGALAEVEELEQKYLSLQGEVGERKRAG